MNKLKPGITLRVVNVAQGWIVCYTIQGENIPHVVPGCWPRFGDAMKAFTEYWDGEREKVGV